MGEFTINGARNLDITSSNPVLTGAAYLKLKNSVITHILSDYGHFLFHEWKGDAFTIWLSQYHLEHNATLYGAVNEPALEIQFALGDDVEYLLEGIGKIKMPGYTFNLCYEPYVENKVFMRKGSKVITFDVHLTITYLQELCELFPLLNPFVNKVFKGDFSLFKTTSLPASASMIYIINAILNGPEQLELQRKMVGNQVEMLLLEAFHQLTEHLPKALKPSVHEQKSLDELRHFLITHLDDRRTIPELAKLFAVNDCKLKQLFKNQYGSTIHEFHNRERMVKACEMLLNNIPISEIAYTIGYSASGPFIRAFEKEFLITPLQFRKRN